jgi:hypothetical protein
MIDRQVPKDWKNLENKVAQILSEAGFKTEVEKDITTARGTVKVDVFAVDISQLPNICYICECKYWENKVPKTVVHSFRTVVQDYGANFGILISKNGFQEGSYETVKNTNISLVDWFDFQKIFEDRWWTAISVKLYNQFDTLIRYADITPSNFVTDKWRQIENDKRKCRKFSRLLQKYREIGYTIMGLGVEALMPLRTRKPMFPMIFEVPTSNRNQIRTITLNSLREYTDCLILYGQKALNEFAELFDENSSESKKS